MKMSHLLITLISVVLVFILISSVQDEITWPLLILLLVVGFVINFFISLLSRKEK